MKRSVLTGMALMAIIVIIALRVDTDPEEARAEDGSDHSVNGQITD